jgi:tetratricopeptide (TPR) repeat protein/DNA-binding transcriptional ArsR family regulator
MIATDAPDGAGPPLSPSFDPLALTEELLDAALSALRQGTLELAVRQRPRAARWLMRRLLPIVEGTFGEAWSAQAAVSEAPELLLRWLITQLRPDLEPRLDGIADEAWLNRVAWRPMIALMCHVRLATVPAFPARYRKRADEAAVDNLCGLWDVGPSTFYRYVERGKHQMAQIATESPLGVARRLSLRRFVAAELALRHLWTDEAGRLAWHRAQVHRLRQRNDAVSALWHSLQALDADLATDTLRTHAAALAGAPETDALVERAAALPMGARARFDLWAARAGLARTRNAVDRELAAHERAVHVATEASDALLLGMAYGALGRFHESRDADRAFACYEDSARYLLSADPQHNDPDAVAQYMTTLVRLAWMHVLRNHPQAKAMLERAEQLSRAQPVPEDLVGMLEQSWGEYWRSAGDHQRALQAKHRALNVYERLGDQRSILVTYLNLITLHGEARELDKALRYAERVFEFARKDVVEPSILVSTRGNLAAAHIWAGDYAAAIAEYAQGLELASSANLKLHTNRIRYNLANAYYRRSLESRDAALERLGDEQLERFFAAPLSERTPALTESARNLKSEVFGAQPEKPVDRLLSNEAAEHLDEMAEIQRQRSVLQADEAPEARVRAHLAIAKAYLQISVKEREAARQLIERHGLDERFAEDLGRLHATFDRQLSREQRVAAQWSRQAADLLDDPRRGALIERLLRDGSINKSAYADLNAVSPATASKHLALLMDRGLLTRSGQGPSTKYLLSG